MRNDNGGNGLALLILACIFIPFLFEAILVFLVLIIIVCAADSLVKKAASTNESGKIRLNVPAISSPTAPSVSALSEEESNAIVEAALTETNRQMAYVVCSDPKFREKYFQVVFTRLCERQGVKLDKLVWKS